MNLYLIVGAYTHKESKGISVYRFYPETGMCERVMETAADNPSFLALSHDQQYLYAVSESEGSKAAVNAFFFDRAEGKLTFLNRENTRGDSPCYLTVDQTNSYVITANYSGGSISLFKTKTGGLLNPVGQVAKFNSMDESKESHIHCILFSPDNRYFLATDLGLDKLYRFSFNPLESEIYIPEDPTVYSFSPGTGPRHMVFGSGGRFLYLISELSDEVFVFLMQGEKPELIQQQKAYHYSPGGSGDIHLSPDGRFLYTSHRLEGDGISIFSVDSESGKLSHIAYQKTAKHPRYFTITPDGRFLFVASMDDNVIQLFKRDVNTGLLTKSKMDISVSMPTCLLFMESE